MVGVAARYFGFCQFEFACALGPEDGRYLLRGLDEDRPERVCVLASALAPRRSRFRRRFRRARDVSSKPVAIARVTVAHPPGFSSSEEAEQWLKELRSNARAAEETVRTDATALNRLVRAHRIASGDAYVHEVASDHALAIRLGYATGDQIADGGFESAYEFSLATARKRRAQRIAPQEQIAATLAGRATPLACEELALRARVDLEAKALKPATLQARLALETALVEARPSLTDAALKSLQEHADALNEASPLVLAGDMPQDLEQRLTEALRALQRALLAIRSQRG